MSALKQFNFQHCLPKIRDVAVTVEKALLHQAVDLALLWQIRARLV